MDVDSDSWNSDNFRMSTDATTINLPPQLVADADAVIHAAMNRAPLDPEVARRVHDRAARITEEIRRKHGVLDVAVPAIRELRDA